MPNVDSDHLPEPPSSRSLFRSTLIAAAVAGAILVTIVLPAEYGVDPTGVGQLLGLKRMGEIKVALARESAADAAASENAADSTPAAAVGQPAASAARPDSTPVASQAAGSSHETRVTLVPGEAKEIKLAMRKGARATYTWSTDRGALNFDTHGDSLNAPKSYHNYSKGTGKTSDEGVLVAAFDGMHGWFWRNRSRDTVTVTLRTSGDYRELKRMN